MCVTTETRRLDRLDQLDDFEQDSNTRGLCGSLTGGQLCRGKSEYLTMQNIVQGKFWTPEGAGEDFRDLIEKLLRRQPSERLGFHSIEELQAHPVFSGAPLGLGILCFHSIEELQAHPVFSGAPLGLGILCFHSLEELQAHPVFSGAPLGSGSLDFHLCLVLLVLTTKGYDHKTPIRTSFDQRFNRYYGVVGGMRLRSQSGCVHVITLACLHLAFQCGLVFGVGRVPPLLFPNCSCSSGVRRPAFGVLGLICLRLWCPKVMVALRFDTLTA